MGTWGLVWSLAFVGGPSLGMMLFASSPAALWAVCGCLGVVAAVIISLERRSRVPVPPMAAAATGEPAG